MVKIELDERIARVSDILEQIHDLNKLIQVLVKEKGDASSIRQYMYMRNEFVKELKQILKGFDLKVEPLEKAV
jgi:flagellar hook-associated protein FlgK